jgi:hypothetical protein
MKEYEDYLAHVDIGQSLEEFFSGKGTWEYPLHVSSEIKKRLTALGFKKEYVDGPERFKNRLDSNNMLDSGLWSAEDFYDFPEGIVSISDGGICFNIRYDVEALLRVLISIQEIVPFLSDPKCAEVYFRTLDFFRDMVRACAIPYLIDKHVKNSLETRNLKKLVMRSLIENIFKKKPNRPKTLGEVCTSKSRSGKDVVIVTGDNGTIFEYAKRSLQRFIDELKQKIPS